MTDAARAEKNQPVEENVKKSEIVKNAKEELKTKNGCCLCWPKRTPDTTRML